MNIRLNNIRVYAHHGCWPEEEIVGGEYAVDVRVDTDFNQASENDDLSLTVDYVKVRDIVYREMAVRSKLIEAVLARIVKSIRAEFPGATSVWVKVTKFNAPMRGQVESVSVEMEI
ncbi:MAG: dihydroneopterin aldolase [Flavobacteriales bacterium]|nr:dihydroneopterin aldolase [Flavobacteriales bacterium]